jgi:hypothetical protein
VDLSLSVRYHIYKPETSRQHLSNGEHANLRLACCLSTLQSCMIVCPEGLQTAEQIMTARATGNLLRFKSSTSIQTHLIRTADLQLLKIHPIQPSSSKALKTLLSSYRRNQLPPQRHRREARRRRRTITIRLHGRPRVPIPGVLDGQLCAGGWCGGRW